MNPGAAYIDRPPGELLLPYEAVRTASDPCAVLPAFFPSTYEATAEPGPWDRAALEASPTAEPGHG